MNKLDSIIDDNRMKMQSILLNHIDFIRTIYDQHYNIDDLLLNDNDLTSSSSSSSSSSNQLFPLLIDEKKNLLLHTVSKTMKQVDKTLNKQLKNVKNKETFMFKFLLFCTKMLKFIKTPIYTMLGIIGIPM